MWRISSALSASAASCCSCDVYETGSSFKLTPGEVLPAESSIRPTSLEALLSGRLNHIQVRTAGYVGITREGAVLYTSKEAFKYREVENGVALELSASQRAALQKSNRRVIRLEGTFVLNTPMWGSECAGTLKRISGITPLVRGGTAE